MIECPVQRCRLMNWSQPSEEVPGNKSHPRANFHFGPFSTFSYKFLNKDRRYVDQIFRWHKAGPASKCAEWQNQESKRFDRMNNESQLTRWNLTGWISNFTFHSPALDSVGANTLSTLQACAGLSLELSVGRNTWCWGEKERGLPQGNAPEYKNHLQRLRQTWLNSSLCEKDIELNTKHHCDWVKGFINCSGFIIQSMVFQ